MDDDRRTEQSRGRDLGLESRRPRVSLEGEQIRQVWAVVALAGAFAVAEARGDSEPVRSGHGGVVTRMGHYQFAVYFYRTGVRVFPQRPVGTPLAVSRIAGTATFYHPNSPKPWFTRPLRGSTATPGEETASLDLVIDLSKVPPTGVKVTFEIAGLPDDAEPTVAFTVPLEFVTAPASGGIVASSQPARSHDGVPPLFRTEEGLLYHGLGDSLPTRHDPTPPLMSAPRVSLYGYGRVPSSSPGGQLPYVSGHAVFIMPSGSLDVPLARPWLRPLD